MERSTSPERNQRDIPRIDAAFHRHAAKRTRHGGVGGGDDGLGGPFG